MKPLDPIPIDEAIIVWPDGVGRDDFILMLSQVIDGCATVGYDCPFDGPQLAAWLESPDRADRARAVANIQQLRQTLRQVAT